jgi:hypothetical protein
MAQMRYRKPSVKTLLGVTKWKKRAKKALGINVVLKPFRLVGNYQRRVLRRAGYYRPEMKMMRAMQRGQVAGPLGPLQVGEKAGDHQPHDQNNASLLMAAALAQHEQKQGHAQKQEDDGPGLAGAMLLAAAMGGTKEKQHKEPAEHAHAKQAPQEEHHRAPAQHHAAEDAPGKSGRAAQKKPRRRGLRLWGLVVTVLLVAAAIVSIWYFWLA